MPPNGRWSPMMFNDFSIIQALGSYDNESLVNMSLGGTGCPLDGSTPGLGERLALGQVMSNMVTTKESLEWFVAAAGNDGTGQTLQFPAAWRHPSVTAGLAQFLRTRALLRRGRDRRNSPKARCTRSSQSVLSRRRSRVAPGMISEAISPTAGPGSTRPPTAAGRSASTPRQRKVATNQSPPGPARWSGTSFATANFTAALASDLVDPDPNAFDPSAFEPNTGARMMDPNTGFDCGLPTSPGSGDPPQ